MARAPETGFYFEPVGERLALVVEGSPFPTDDHWAWLGDPIEMTPQQAQLVVAVRWPGIDPGELEVEFDLNFDRAVAEAERKRREDEAGVERVPTEFDVDLQQLLAQAEMLSEQVRAASLHAPPEQAREAAAEAESLRSLLLQAQALREPARAGQAMAVAEAPPQSMSLVRSAGAPAEEAVESGPDEAAAPLSPARTNASSPAASRGPREPPGDEFVDAEVEWVAPAPVEKPVRARAPSEPPAPDAPKPARKRPNIRKG